MRLALPRLRYQKHDKQKESLDECDPGPPAKIPKLEKCACTFPGTETCVRLRRHGREEDIPRMKDGSITIRSDPLIVSPASMPGVLRNSPDGQRRHPGGVQGDLERAGQ